MSNARYVAYAINEDGTTLPVKKGHMLTSFRNEEWTYESTTHPRKVNVSRKEDPTGSDFWPNKENGEFYASVFNLGIWDDLHSKWSFTPEWEFAVEDPKDCQSLSCQGPWYREHKKHECK